MKDEIKRRVFWLSNFFKNPNDLSIHFKEELFFPFSSDLSVVWHLSMAGRWRCHQRPRATSIEYIVPQLKVTLHSDAATPPWY
jgi:hypothetical protein